MGVGEGGGTGEPVHTTRSAARALPSTSFVTAPSDTFAGDTTTSVGKPRRRRGRGTRGRAAAWPRRGGAAPPFGRLHRLAVQDGRTALGPPPQRHLRVPARRPGRPFPDPGALPAADGGGDGRPRRERARQQAPGAPSAEPLADGIRDLVGIDATRVTTGPGGRDQRRRHAPLVVGQVGQVSSRYPPGSYYPLPLHRHLLRRPVPDPRRGGRSRRRGRRWPGRGR